MDTDEKLKSVSAVLKEHAIALTLGSVSIVCIIAAVVLFFRLLNTSEPIRFSSDANLASASAAMVVVDIEGAVQHPGVYTLPEGSRIEDLLSRAGGIRGDADTAWVAKTLNRASMLSDGAKFYIPFLGATVNPQNLSSEPESGSVPTMVSINTASSSELEVLPGIGEVTAGKIIAGRPYQRLEELLERKIVGQSVWEKIRLKITL